jgi:hypothetical protein
MTLTSFSGIALTRAFLLAAATGLGSLLGAQDTHGHLIWRAEEQVSSNSRYSYLPHLTKGPSGKIHVVWADGVYGSSDWQIRYAERSGSWSPEEILSTGTSNHSPSIVSEQNGTLHVVWDKVLSLNSEAILYRRWDGEWSATTTLYGGGWNRGPGIVLDGAGALHVLWWNNTGGLGLRRIMYLKNDGTWKPARELSAGERRYWPEVAIDDNDYLHVVWFGGMTGSGEVYYKRGKMAWVPEIRLSEIGDESERPDIAVDALGGVHVVWTDFRDGNEEIYYKGCTNGVWGPDTRISPPDGETSWMPTVEADDHGNVYVAWADLREGEQIYFRMWSGGTWETEVRLTELSGPKTTPDLLFANGLHLVWADGRDGEPEIYYRRAYPRPQSTPAARGVSGAARGATGAGEFTGYIRVLPNPVRSEATFCFAASRTGIYRIKIFDMAGRVVRVLAHKELPVGDHSVSWDGRDEAGLRVAGGIYFVKLTTGEATQTRKVVFLGGR